MNKYHWQGATEKSNGTTQKSNPSYSKVGPCATQKSEQNINLLNNKSIKNKRDIYREKIVF